MNTSQIISFPSKHLSTITRKHNQTKQNVESKIYNIMIKASGLPDFEENRSFYIWYASEYCFGQPCEMRNLEIERKLRDSKLLFQLPF